MSEGENNLFMAIPYSNSYWKQFAGAGPACVVGALAPYNHGVPLAGAARDPLVRGHGPLLHDRIIVVFNENQNQVGVMQGRRIGVTNTRVKFLLFACLLLLMPK